MSVWDILMLVGGAGAVYYLFKPRKQPKTTQELLDFKEIYPDGIIELPGGRYRLVIEVEPINMALRSLQEQAAIWLNFRNLVNAINLPCTFLVQTRYLDIKGYLNYVRESAEGQPEKIKNFGYHLAGWLEQKVEVKNLRDRRFYVILKIDPGTGVESGIQIESPALNALVSSFSGIKKTAAREKNTARDELNDAANVIRSFLEGMDIRSKRLNREEVLEVLYQTFNRDMAPFASFTDANRMEAFNLLPVSVTPELVQEKILQRVVDTDEKESSTVWK
ncbi:MAG: hypothetical protein K6U74_20805 [Firmicutes bacterium]|nr:hypothetical protein [Bacillota bacterium]